MVKSSDLCFYSLGEIARVMIATSKFCKNYPPPPIESIHTFDVLCFSLQHAKDCAAASIPDFNARKRCCLLLTPCRFLIDLNMFIIYCLYMECVCLQVSWNSSVKQHVPPTDRASAGAIHQLQWGGEQFSGLHRQTWQLL